MKLEFKRWAWAMLTILGLAGAASAQAQGCVAGNWVSPPNSLWDSTNGSFPVRAESARFQIRWPGEILTPQQAQAALAQMETVLNWFTGPVVKWPEPYCDSAVKYKVQIFVNNGYGFTGSGAGDRAQAMWVGPSGMFELISGNPYVFVHEFTHTMQYHSMGMRDTLLGGWFWESHAEFMSAQYPGSQNKTGGAGLAAWMPHIHFGSTRLRYNHWVFWDFLKNKYGFGVVNDIFLKTARQTGQDPLSVLMRNQGWTPALLGDEFGQFAMRNVTWDYFDSQDGFNRGAAYRNAFGPVTDLGPNREGYELAKRFRLSRLEAIDQSRRRFVVSKHFAPQRYGYNLVKLVPDVGATSLTVSFNGVVQRNIAAGAEVGRGAFEPGAPGWTSFTMPTNPASNWRWSVVAIDQSGNPRYSPMQRGAAATLNVPLQAGDQGVYLVVAATPDEYHGIFWDQKYHSIYRYPYTIELAGAMPDGFQPGYQTNVANGFPAGARHPNGGGWVANGAVVAPTAFVGPNAAVLGGRVLGSARIEDYGTVWSGTVQDNAIVGGLTQFGAKATLAENARIRTVMAGGLTDGAVIKGTTNLYGDLATTADVRVLTQGAFTGFLDGNMSTKAEFGANRTSAPVEVTAPMSLPASWATDCAQEGQTCVLPAGHMAAVWYGADARYSVRSNLSGSIACNNSSFGDPAVGTGKSCLFVWTAPSASPPAQAVKCAEDTQNCVLPAGHRATVWYGAGSRFSLRTDVSGSLACNPASFSGDPAVGSWKSCSYVVTAASVTPSAQAVTCAQESQTCTVPAGHTATVWYGAGTRFRVRMGVTGSLACSPATFGDPAFGVWKTCSYAVTATPPTPPAYAVSCAQEGQTCVLPAGSTATVWYGTGTRFTARAGLSGNVACNAATFFGDPAIGAWKSCSYVRN